MISADGGRDCDLVLFGATGFVGRLVARRLAELELGELRVGLAGRTPAKLQALSDELGVDWPLIVADSSDAGSLAELARRSRVVVTTVGPYARDGLPLVRACAEAGTHYADLTGEPKFVRDSIDANQDTATRTGAKIVHACGFDSVPSDLGMLALADRVSSDGAGELTTATLLVISFKGGLSGGTIDSMRVGIDDVRDDPSLARKLSDPYLLSPDRGDEPDLGRQSNTFLAQKLDDGSWVAPFIMASFNAQIVRRSNALLGHRYGRELRYREVVRTGSSLLAPVVAGGIALGTGALALGMQNRFSRPLLDRLLPDPGQGPSEKVQRNGRFRLDIRGITTTGATYTATVAADGDPGYAATSVMLSQAGLCLASDDLPAGGGVLTPAVAMGDALTARLRAKGFTLDVRRTS
jgi:short subunit dehydrogenase-like uncharacterized protein